MSDDRAAPMKPVPVTLSTNEVTHVVEQNAFTRTLVEQCLGYLHRRYFVYIASAFGALFAMLCVTIVILVQQIRVLSALRRR
jgi:hypothetical protein